jgi:predicted cupin superfamily sugar epimerase
MAQEGDAKMKTAQDVIAKLDLKPLQDEGGYFKETYRSSTSLPARTFGIDGSGNRTVTTAIYFLLAPNSFSALHRLKSDEIFHFYAGDPVEMVQIDPNGTLTRYTIGSDIFSGQIPQVVVPAGTWQALRLKSGGAWALMGTTVAPGFEFEDFELGDRQKMDQLFPQHRKDIIRFSRGPSESTH